MSRSESVLGRLLVQLFNSAELNPGKVYQCPLKRGLTVLVKRVNGSTVTTDDRGSADRVNGWVNG